MCEEGDPGQAAGDTVMTYAAERGLDIEGSGVYPIALHTAALADIVTTLLRQNAIWARPADKTINGLPWVSAAFLDPSGVRLHRVLLLSRWSEEREKAERCSWGSLGEQSVYELPMTIHICVLGQRRNQKHVGAFSQGYLHPRSRGLRIRKKTGEGFGAAWTKCWREEQDTISRDKWIDAMQEDGVLPDVMLELNCDPPPAKIASEIRLLAEKKLRQIQETTKTPDMNPSSCWWPTPCQFAFGCWNFQAPSQRTGFVPVSLPSPQLMGADIEVLFGRNCGPKCP